MKHVIVFSLICCALFTKCHTSTKYLMKDYDPSLNNRLVRILMLDSTEYNINHNTLYKFENDSTLIVSSLKSNLYNSNKSYSAGYDTLMIKNINSIYVSELNIGLTLFASTIGVGATLYSVAWLMLAMSR